MKHFYISTTIGILLFCLGLTGIIWPYLALSDPSNPLFTNNLLILKTAVCFIIIGSGILLNSYHVKHQKQINLIIGFLLIGIASFAFIVGFFQLTNIGFHSKVYDGMEPYTSIALILSGIWFVLISSTKKNNTTLELINYIIIILGISTLYKWQQDFPVAIASGSGLILLGIGFKLIWYQSTDSMQSKILESEMRFRSAFDYSPIGIAIVSLEGRWLKVNKALCNIIGYSESELLTLDFQKITYPDDLSKDLEYLKELYDGKIAFYQLEKRYIKKDSATIWILLTVTLIRNEQGIPLYYISQIQDINDKKKTEDDLSYRAYYDTLTGLSNRNHLEHSLEAAISSALRHQQRFAIFFLDLDNFKKINDTFGHDTGDEVLKVTSDRLKDNIRKTDIVSRHGGDEFILVLTGIYNVETASIFAEKIINILIQPMRIKERDLFITSSIGISFYPSDGTNSQALIKSADLALYKAKELGRNNYQFCTPEMNLELKEKIRFKNALHTALNKHEFHLVFLPKLDVKKNIISGFEALLRWKNNQYGDVSPTKIISLADEMGIINQLSHWITTTATAKTKVWQQMEFKQPPKIAVNISPRNFMEANFVEKILEVLDSNHFPPSYLELEITENLIMHDPEYSLNIIRALKSNHIQVIIDNFGTGYSSLNYLYQFSVDYIKIDRRFTRRVSIDDHEVSFLIAMVKLAKNLNIKILAEGVESKEQFDLLTNIGFDEIQGYYISPPLLDEQVPKFLENYKSVEVT